MYELWNYLTRLPVAIVLAIGVFILIRHRRRSRKATGLALAALYGLVGWWLVVLAMVATNVGWGTLPIEWRLPVVMTVSTLREIWLAVCILLLVLAVLADRGGEPPTGPEADYVDVDEPGER